MIVVADTNVILRVIVTLDASQQTEAAITLFEQADEVVIPPTALCEAVWVLHSAYGRDRVSIIYCHFAARTPWDAHGRHRLGYGIGRAVHA